MAVKVGINGYGTIGKRIADALRNFREIEVVGIVKANPDYGARIAASKGYKIYVAADRVKSFEERGLSVSGTIEDLVEEVDVVVDATPSGAGAKYLDLYKKKGKPAIFQGGERHESVDVSFSSLCNYEDALDKKYVRVVSCNTTGLLRVICLLNEELGVERVRATIVRRGADPKEDSRGPINSIVLDPPRVPSHHAIDVMTVLPWLDIETVALATPTTLMHVHSVSVQLKSRTTIDRVVEALSRTRRILLISAEDTGIDSTAKLIESSRDIGRSRYDLPENVVWIDSLKIKGNELLLVQAIHQESVVIPENVDAIKSISGLETDKWKAIRDTDEKLRLGELPVAKRLGEASTYLKNARY